MNGSPALTAFKALHRTRSLFTVVIALAGLKYPFHAVTLNMPTRIPKSTSFDVGVTPISTYSTDRP